MIGYFKYWVVLSYLSMISAVTGMVFAMDGDLRVAFICLMVSGVCDMLDGPVARLKKDRTDREKSFGIQIDSLADLVSFGVYPLVIGYALGLTRWWHIIIMTLYVLSALIRLAYYNVTEMEIQQSNGKRTHYCGLPVTNAAAIIPFTYFACLYFAEHHIRSVYCVMLAVLSVAYVTKFKVPKIGMRYIIVMCAVLLMFIIFFIVSSY